MTDTPQLAGDTAVWLAKNKPEWLAGRYIKATWDMEELVAKKEEIVQSNKLKIVMSI